MTSTLIDDIDDDETIQVVIPQSISPPAKRVKAATGHCKQCGVELEDRRRAWCTDCRSQDTTTTTLKRPSKKSSVKVVGVTAQVTQGMNSISGKLLYILTLVFAWSQLRRLGVPDPNGDLADEMAMTDDEAEIIGRPLTRLFLQTEPGRRLAPKIVEHEDFIDAAFAAWDWYKRVTSTLDQYNGHETKGSYNRPTTVQRSTNGKVRQITPNRGEGEGDETSLQYTPPSPFDLVGTN